MLSKCHLHSKRCVSVQANLIHNIKKRIPEPVKNRVRTIEVAAGRSAFLGLLSGAFIGNLTGTSFIQQYHNEEPLVLSMVIIVTGVTCLPNLENGLTKADVKHELMAERFSMAVMVFLLLLENSFK